MVDGRDGAPVARAGGRARAARELPEQGRAVFLDRLAATCDVTAAAAIAGVAVETVHALRRRDAEFAAGWGEALAAGYQVLETRLVGRALAGGAAEGDGVDVDLALKLLAARRGADPGKASRGAAPVRTASAAETNAALLKRLRMVESRPTGRGLADG